MPYWSNTTMSESECLRMRKAFLTMPSKIVPSGVSTDYATLNAAAVSGLACVDKACATNPGTLKMTAPRPAANPTID